MTTARSINLGFRIPANTSTTLTVTMPSSDSTAEACIFRGDDGTCNGISLSNNNTQFQVTLTTTTHAQDYALTVDSTTRPGSSAPFTVSFSNSTLLWSAQNPDLGATPRPWASTTDVITSVEDPKDPWPLFTTPTAGVSAFGSSSIATKMGTLLGTSYGRNGVEESDETAAAAS